jgi:hypothetical protein
MIIVRVPIGFDRKSIKEKLVSINELAASENEIVLDKMLFLIMEIYRTSMRYYFIAEFESKMAPLKAEIIKKNLGYVGNIKYNDVIELLIRIGLIVVDEHYVINKHSKHYGLVGVKNHELVTEELKKWQPKDKKRKTLYLHNFIMNRLTFDGKGSTETVDHINGNGFDNRKVNLRIISQSLQNMNTNHQTISLKTTNHLFH